MWKTPKQKHITHPTFKKNPPKSKKGITIGGPIESATEMLELTQDIKYPVT